MQIALDSRRFCRKLVRVPYPRTVSARRLPRDGFALVIALALMSFVLLLLLTISSFVRVESSLSQTTLARLEARQNARLGAMVALGNLQKTMGPDTRVSARAELLSAATPGASGEADESTRFWTGVWDSAQDWLETAYSPDAAGPRDAQPYLPYKGNRENFLGTSRPRFRSWLVSLPDDERSEINSPRTALAAGTNFSAPMAKMRVEPLSGGSVAERIIRAPLVNLEDGGAIAWWVSDEGVKANITLTDPFLGQTQPTPTEDTSRFLFPHRENFAATDWFQNTDFDDTTLIERLRKVGVGDRSPWLAFRDAAISTEAETAFLGAPVANSLFSDYTIHSNGVISNNKKGGLRKDLSLAFWRDPFEMLNPTGGVANAGFNTDFSSRTSALHGRIFNKEDYPDRTVRSSLALRFFGPQWDTLRDFHNSFQKLEDPDDTSPVARLDPLRTIGDFNPRALFGGADGVGQTDERNSLHEYAGGTAKGAILNTRFSVERGGLNSSPLVPVVLGVYFTFGADVVELSKADPADPTEYEPRFIISTIVNLWNPYSVSISPVDLSGNALTRIVLGTYLSDLQFTFLKNGAGIDGSFSLGELFANLGRDRDEIRFEITNTASNLQFLPGEIRQYRLSTGTTLLPDSPEGTLIFPASATPGFDPSETYGDGDEVRVEMSLPASRFVAGGGTFGGIRMDLTAESAGGVETLQWNRYDFYFEETPGTTYVDFDEAQNLANSATEDLFVAAIDFSYKSAEGEGEDVAGIVANFNPAAIFPGGALPSIYPGFQPPNLFARIVRDPVEVQLDATDPTRFRGLWGNSRETGLGLGQPFVTLFDIPRKPPESLGQYQHASLSYFATQPANAFGNSMAHPHINREFAHDAVGSYSQIDLSWFLNDAIWDDYFLSTIDKGPSGTGSSLPQRERFLALDPTREFRVDRAEDYKEVASNLLLRGAFNVNSTSVEAWTAFLSSLGGSQPAGNLSFPYHRMSYTTQSANTVWTGGPRDLTRSEIQALAEAVVAQVRVRGPFLSLSDFVNRRLESGVIGQMGALQAAIGVAGLNTLLPNLVAVLSTAPQPGNVVGPTAALAPGDISQADVLTTIGPKMSARSDTFIIRSYGRAAQNGGGANTGEAWCEMLVQRFPEDHENREFGRPFKVLSFRFLDESEI